MPDFTLKAYIDRWLTRGSIGYLKGCYDPAPHHNGANITIDPIATLNHVGEPTSAFGVV